MADSGTQSPPRRLKSNPGIGFEGNIAFARGEKTWTESFNAVELAAAVLIGQGYSVQSKHSWLEHEASGYILLPQLVELQPFDDGGVRTVTTIQIHHPTLVPDGIFEYQHSTGDTTAESISKGFEQWAQMDFVPLLEALQPKLESCTSLQVTVPANDSKPARLRRVVLGPVMHYRNQPPLSDDEHPFCPCCLITNSFEPFRDLIETDGFYGVRLFAARVEDGSAEADCRVNGEDWEKGMQALRKYAATWPEAGYEFRKQYVVMQTLTL